MSARKASAGDGPYPLPEGWRWVKLGEVARIDRDSVKPEDMTGNEPYLGLDCIASGGNIIRWTTTSAEEVTSNKFSFTADHVLMGKLRPYLGKIAAPDRGGVCSTDIIPLNPGPLLERSYLLHWLRMDVMVQEANKVSSGANLPRISPKAIAELDVPLPPLSEQRRISDILDRAKLQVESAGVSVESAAILPGSLVERLLNSEIAEKSSLGDLALVTSGITKGRKISTPAKITPYLAVANVQAGSLSLGTVKEIPATEKEIERYRLVRGDLLLTEGGDPDKLGRGTLWREEIPLCLHQNHVFRVRIRDAAHILPEYLAGFVGSKEARSYFRRSAKQTTGIASINMAQLKQLQVPVPSMYIQREYVRQLDLVRGRQALLQARNDLNLELFSSLQSRAFRGEL